MILNIIAWIVISATGFIVSGGFYFWASERKIPNAYILLGMFAASWGSGILACMAQRLDVFTF